MNFSLSLLRSLAFFERRAACTFDFVIEAQKSVPFHSAIFFCVCCSDSSTANKSRHIAEMTKVFTRNVTDLVWNSPALVRPPLLPLLLLTLPHIPFSAYFLAAVMRFLFIFVCLAVTNPMGSEFQLEKSQNMRNDTFFLHTLFVRSPFAPRSTNRLLLWTA